MGVLAGFLGGTLGSYIVLHLILLAYQKKKHRVPSILQAGALTLAATTLIAGYGLRDGRPSPLFLEAFVTYLPYVVLAVPIRLFRTRHHRAS